MTGTSLPWATPLVGARFVERPNRFVVVCDIDGAPPGSPPERVHMADPGRLRELLLPGAELRVRPADRPGRATRWSAVLVRAPTGAWVSLDTTLPNRLVRRALLEGSLSEFEGWTLERAEWTHGSSRIDFLLRRSSGFAAGTRVEGDDASQMALEVKSVTLVEDGIAWFPDAVTARGARHLDELAGIARTPGWRAAVLFVLQRDDAREIRPAVHLDPRFAERLTAARAAGVEVYGRRCMILEDGVGLGTSIEASTAGVEKPFGGVRRL